MSSSNNQGNGKKERKGLSPDAMKRAVILAANTLILTFIYFGTMGLRQPILSVIVTLGYWLALAALAVAYIIYNRGFTRKNVTEDMLPDTWSKEKKEEFIADGKRRAERSKWLLTVIITVMIPIALDAIYLFTWPMIQDLFSFK